MSIPYRNQKGISRLTGDEKSDTSCDRQSENESSKIELKPPLGQSFLIPDQTLSIRLDIGCFSHDNDLRFSLTSVEVALVWLDRISEGQTGIVVLDMMCLPFQQVILIKLRTYLKQVLALRRREHLTDDVD